MNERGPTPQGEQSSSIFDRLTRLLRSIANWFSRLWIKKPEASLTENEQPRIELPKQTSGQTAVPPSTYTPPLTASISSQEKTVSAVPDAILSEAPELTHQTKPKEIRHKNHKKRPKSPTPFSPKE